MRKNLLALFAILHSFNATAQDEKIVVELEKTTVTAERFETLEKKTTKNIAIITKEEIKNSKAQNIVDLLKTVPSVFARNGYTNDGIIDLRGQGETAKSNVLVLVDGVSLNTINMAGPDLSTIDIGNIERIEVVPSGGVVYGDKAVGGVVNIITSKNSSSAKIETGSYGLLNYGLNLNENFGKTSFTGAFSKNTSEGYRKNSNTEKSNAKLGLGYKFDEKNQVTISYEYNKGDIKFPGGLTKSQLENDRKDSVSGMGESHTEKNSYGLVYNFDGQKFDFENRLNYAKKTDEFDWSGWGSDEITTETFINNTKFKFITGNNAIITGVDYNKGSSLVGVNKTEKIQTGVYALDTISLSKNLDVSLGLRKEHIKLNFYSGKEKTYDETLHSLGINYSYSNSGTIYISKEVNYRTPVTDEYYNSFANTYNENLKPQTSDNIEIGAREYFLNTYFKTSYFKNNTKNEIFYNPNTWANENIEGETERTGLELSAKTFINDFVITQSYSKLDAKIKDGSFAGKSIPWVPNNRYVLNVLYNIDALSLSGELIHTGEMFAISDWSNSKAKEEAYNVININAAYKINSISLYGGIKNLTDEKYNEAVIRGTKFYPSLDRNYYLGLSYEF